MALAMQSDAACSTICSLLLRNCVSEVPSFAEVGRARLRLNCSSDIKLVSLFNGASFRHGLIALAVFGTVVSGSAIAGGRCWYETASMNPDPFRCSYYSQAPGMFSMNRIWVCCD